MVDKNETGSAVSDKAPVDEDNRNGSAVNGSEPEAAEEDRPEAAEEDRIVEVEADSEGTIGSEAGGEAGVLETGSAPATGRDRSSDAYHASVTAKAGTTAGLISGLIKELRPKQWVKNILVLAVPFGAGMMFQVETLLAAAIAFVVFSMAASGIYFINDAIDVESDRQHPTKRNRPIAAGLIPLPVAYAVSAVLLIGSLAISAAMNTTFLAVMSLYVLVQLGYCFGLKHQPVIDLCIVGSGFLLRAIAGGAAAGLFISQWFYLIVAFGSLFMVAGKRYAEVKLAHETGAKIRKSLKAYSPSYLRFVWATSAAITIMSYTLWAYDIQEDWQSRWGLISIIPFVIAILRYAVDIDKGVAGEPEEVALKDKILLVLGGLLACFLFMAYYL